MLAVQMFTVKGLPSGDGGGKNHNHGALRSYRNSKDTAHRKLHARGFYKGRRHVSARKRRNALPLAF